MAQRKQRFRQLSAGQLREIRALWSDPTEAERRLIRAIPVRERSQISARVSSRFEERGESFSGGEKAAPLRDCDREALREYNIRRSVRKIPIL